MNMVQHIQHASRKSAFEFEVTFAEILAMLSPFWGLVPRRHILSAELSTVGILCKGRSPLNRPQLRKTEPSIVRKTPNSLDMS